MSAIPAQAGDPVSRGAPGYGEDNRRVLSTLPGPLNAGIDTPARENVL